MLKDAVAVFDIGSSKVTGLIGENGINKNFIIRAISEVRHEGFCDGVLDNPQSLISALRSAFKSVSETAKARIDEVFVGVPGDFTVIENRQHRVYYNRRKKLRSKDVNEFLSEAGSTVLKNGYEVVSRHGVFYYLDGERRVENLLNEVTSSVNGYITFFLAENHFLGAVRSAFSSLGVKKITFVPSSLAESLFLFSPAERFSYILLLDVGYISSSFSVCFGGGLLYHKSFPIGGGHITAYLFDRLKIDDFELAERIKRRLNLSVPKEAESTYELTWGEEILTFSQKDCNDIARSVIGNIAEQVDKALAESRVKLPHNLPVSLIGGGISYIRGGKEHLGACIEMPVNVICPPIAYMSKPDDSSKLALLNYALNLSE